MTLWLYILFQPCGRQGQDAVQGFSSLAGAGLRSRSPCAAQMLVATLRADAAEQLGIWLLGLALPLRKRTYSQSPGRKKVTEAGTQQLTVVWSSGWSAVWHFARWTNIRNMKDLRGWWLEDRGEEEKKGHERT